MLIEKRPSQSRGYKKIRWLESYHSFSFSSYYDPKRMGFRNLRVINEDWIAPGQGFATHPHDNMEIFTYVIEGALAHKDSMGNVRSITPGMFQRMSAGTGITHSEFNPSDNDTAHLLQIWLLPTHRDTQPSYEDCHYPLDKNQWTCLLGEKGISRVDQAVSLYRAELETGQLSLELQPGQAAWVQTVKGQLNVGVESLQAGDALIFDEITKVESLRFHAAAAEMLVFVFD
jgi:redox-sensitive bicupin YhaK (pirin superfamily)